MGNRIMIEEKYGFLEIIALTLIAGLGGGVAYLQSWLEKGQFRIGHFFAQIAISSFSGGLVGFAFTKVFPDWSYVIAGVSGVFGIQILYFLFNLGVRIFGKQTGVNVEGFELKQKKNKHD
jgi:hypothetical protein